MSKKAEDVLAGFLLADIDLPNPKSTKDELWVWIRAKVTELNIIRRAFLAKSAEGMVSPADRLHGVMEDFRSMCEEYNVDFKEFREIHERINNIANEIAKGHHT